jgi:hypothetical protein
MEGGKEGEGKKRDTKEAEGEKKTTMRCSRERTKACA